MDREARVRGKGEQKAGLSGKERKGKELEREGNQN